MPLHNSKVFIAIFLLLPALAFSQTSPLNKLQNDYVQQVFEQYCLKKKESTVYSIKPFIANLKNIQFDSVMRKEFEIKDKQLLPNQNLIKRFFRNGNLIDIVSNNKKSFIAINPLFMFEVGKEKSETVYQFNRGIRIDMNINQKVFISSSFYENAGRFSKYVNRYIDSLTVVPGFGKARKTGNKIEYAMPLGFIGFKASDNFYLELGNDKNFIGSGYRSLLLSDVAYAYPYFKMQANFGKFSFTNIWGQFTDASKNWVNVNGYDRKYGAFSTITFAGIKKIQVTLFQSVIWTNIDSLGRRKNQEWSYFIPIIYFNSLNFNNGSPDNSMLGIDANYQIGKQSLLYAQVVIDDLNLSELKNGRGFFQNKYGIQVGVKLYEPLHVKNAFARIEFNTVRPYTYGNKNPSINYTHYGEALAHPLGANFREVVFDANYRKQRFLFALNIVLATYGLDTANSHWGKNIYQSDYQSQTGIFSFNNKIAQGLKTNLLYANASINYLMNPFTNSRFTAQITYRGTENSMDTNRETIYSLSFSTGLLNVLRSF